MNQADKILTILLEMPQYYPAQIVYRQDRNFTPISMGNFGRYHTLGEDDTYIYTRGAGGGYGKAFARDDVKNPTDLGIKPAMTVELRDSLIKGYKQAHSLRIRQSHASHHVATKWYLFYVDRMGGIVSDFEHLEGGKALWRSLVNGARSRGYNMTLQDTVTGQSVDVGRETPDTQIWSKDFGKKHLVLVMEKP